MALGDLNLVVSAQVSGATQGLKQVDQSLQRVQGSMARANQATRAMTNQFNSARTSTQKWATGALQQAGYQIGDFAVQVANGTSRMQAFGQQGSQLLGILGPFGAVLGAVVAIVSAFAVAAERAKKGASGASGEIGDLATSVSNYSSAVSRALTPTSDLAIQYGGAAEKARELFEANAQLMQLDAIASLTASARRLQTEFVDLTGRTSGEIWRAGQEIVNLRDQINGLREEERKLLADPERNAFRLMQITPEIAKIQEAILVYGDYNKIITTLQEKLGVGAQEAVNFAANLAKINQVESPQELADAIESARKSFVALVGGAENMNDEQRDLLRQLVLTSIEALNLNTNMGKVAASIEGAKESARGLKNIMSLMGQEDEVIFDPRDPRYNRMRVIMWQIANETGNVGKEAASSTTSLSKMANVTDTALSGIDKMFASLDDITNSVSKTMENAMTDAFMSIVDGTQKPIEAFKNMARLIIAELYKVLVVKQLVGSFDADNPSAATGIVGFLGKAFGGFRANGGPVSGGTPYIVGERGPELFVPSRNGTIVPNGAGAGVTVIQNNTFGNGVSRAEVQAMLPRIVETTKAAVFDAQRRSVNGLGYA